MKLPGQIYVERFAKLSARDKKIVRAGYIIGFLTAWLGMSELVDWTSWLGEPEFEPFYAYWLMGVGLLVMIIPDIAIIWFGWGVTERDDPTDSTTHS